MNSYVKTQIDNIRNALFEGRFADASTTVEDMRQHDPQLNDLAKSFENNHFGLFSFRSFSTDLKYLHEERLARQKLVLTWMSLPHQLDLFGVAIEPEDLCVDLARCIKFDEMTAENQSDLVHLIGYWLSHQKIQEAKYMMEQTGISLHEKVSNMLLVYKNQNVRGAISVRNVVDVPLYTVLTFNYTHQLFDFIRSEGISLAQIASTFAHIDTIENTYPHASEILQGYKNTQLLALKSHVEHLNITQALENDKIERPTARKKM